MGTLVKGRGLHREWRIGVPDNDGRSVFLDLHAKHQDACFYAFDLLWLDGKDLDFHTRSALAFKVDNAGDHREITGFNTSNLVKRDTDFC
jgi:hypothetical protein